MPGSQITGVVLSLVAAFCWAISPMFFASAGRRIGSFSALLLRSLLASGLLLAALPVYAFARGAGPDLPSAVQAGWLVASGLIGMAVGDVLLYESYVLLGPRRTMQVLTLWPVSTVVLAWFWLDEAFRVRTLGGIALVLAGTSYAVLSGRRPENGSPREPGQVSAGGLAIAIAGAVCVALGTVAGRQAFLAGPLDPLVATVVRVVSAAAILWLVPFGRRGIRRTLEHLRSGFVLSRVLPGTLAGPFAGMLCYMAALRHLEAGLVSTLSAMSPLFILPMVAVRYRVPVRADVMIATAVACAGVAVIGTR